MFQKNLLFISFLLILTGCGARTGVGVKNYHLLNQFISNKDYIETSNIIFDMSKYCSSGLYEYKRQQFNSIQKTVISSKLVNRNDYYMSVEITPNDNNTSEVKIYDYYDFETTRKMANTIENWVNKDSNICVQGF